MYGRLIVKPRARRIGVGLKAGLVAAVIAVGLIPAQPQAQNRRAAAPVEAMSIDEAFVQARNAVAQENRTRFEMLAARAAQQPVLGDFVSYWRLRLALAQMRPDEGSDWARLDKEVSQYIARFEDTMAADLLRRDWILNLGRRGDWVQLEALYPTWVLRDESPSHCYGQLATIERMPGPITRDTLVVQAARDTLTQARDLGEPCTALTQALMQRRLISRSEVFQRTLSAAEAGALGTVRRLGGLLGLDAGALENALLKPQRLQGSDREVDLIGLTRWARQEPRELAQRIESLSLHAADRSYLWGQVASGSMRKLEPEAIEYLRQSLQPVTNASAPELRAAPNDDSLSWMIRAALRAQDWNSVRTLTQRQSALAQKDPTWIFWRARALSALKRDEEAQTLYRSIAGQYHFYGQLAGEALGQLTTVPPKALPPTDAEIAEVSRIPGFARALKFYELGLRSEGNREWNYHVRSMNDRQLIAAAQWACSKQILDRCVNTADRTQVEHDFSLRFIQPFVAQMKVAAGEQSLDANWVYGLIRQESRFIMDARSHVGASGLMQLMPATARWVARQARIENFRPELVNDLEINLKLGTFYLKSVLDDLDGSPLLASAAYNAGPNRPRTWRSTLPGPVEGALFAELIPFTETRDYVKKVLSNATFYAALNTGQPQSLQQRLGRVVPKAASTSALP